MKFWTICGMQKAISKSEKTKLNSQVLSHEIYDEIELDQIEKCKISNEKQKFPKLAKSLQNIQKTIDTKY